MPSLNNVALTAPYFLDGSVSTLNEAVRRMGRLNGGRELGNTDVEDIVSFLESLSSEAFAGMSSRMGNMGNMPGMQQQMRQRMQQMHHGQQMNHARHHGASADQTTQMGRH